MQASLPLNIKMDCPNGHKESKERSRFKWSIYPWIPGLQKFVTGIGKWSSALNTEMSVMNGLTL